jgi:hypothetical protein
MAGLSRPKDGVLCACTPDFVMPALVAGIHVFDLRKTWMAGTRPAMTTEKPSLR